MTIRSDTYALATAQGRKPGTAGHEDAINYIRSRFADLDLLPYGDMTDWAHTYTAVLGGKDGRRVTMTNLLGVIPGLDRSLPPIVLGAHYDSVIQSYCADDNASSVAVVLDVATNLINEGAVPKRDVVICAFDGEEPPYFHSPAMGSTRLVEDVLGDVHLAIVLDLVGHPITLPGVDPHLTVVTGIESHPALREVVKAPGDVLPLLPVNNERVGDMSDHHAFRLAGKPFLFLSSGEWENYHTEDDRPEFLDYEKLDLVSYAVEHMIRAAGRCEELGTAEPHDIEDLEAERIDALLPVDLVKGLTHGKPTVGHVQEVVSGMRMAMWHDHSDEPEGEDVYGAMESAP